MYIPYRKEAFNSPIDYAKLIEMQANQVDIEGTKSLKKAENKNKTLVKTMIRGKKVHRGGRK